MLKLLLLTLGTWAVLSLFLVGTLGFLLHLRQQSARAPAILGSAGANLRADGYVVQTCPVNTDRLRATRIG
jgi:hypothetical protein